LILCKDFDNIRSKISGRFQQTLSQKSGKHPSYSMNFLNIYIMKKFILYFIYNEKESIRFYILRFFLTVCIGTFQLSYKQCFKSLPTVYNYNDLCVFTSKTHTSYTKKNSILCKKVLRIILHIYCVAVVPVYKIVNCPPLFPELYQI
jgi:hypothetical protein